MAALRLSAASFNLVCVKSRLLVQRGRELYEADLIGAAKVGELVGMTRQTTHEYMRRRVDAFPQPLFKSAHILLWERREVEEWAIRHLQKKGERKKARELRERSSLVEQEAQGLLEDAEQTDWAQELQRIAQG